MLGPKEGRIEMQLILKDPGSSKLMHNYIYTVYIAIRLGLYMYRTYTLKW